MSDRNGLTSLLTDRKIVFKVGLGFVCVLAILVVTSTTAYFAFSEAAGGFGTYTQRVTVVGIAREIERSFLELRRNAREYAITSADANAAAVRKEAEHLRGLLGQGLTEIKNPDRHAKIEEMARLNDAYMQAFDRVVTSTQFAAKLNATGLPDAGAALARSLDELIADATKAGNAEVVTVRLPTACGTFAASPRVPRWRQNAKQPWQASRIFSRRRTRSWLRKPRSAASSMARCAAMAISFRAMQRRSGTVELRRRPRKSVQRWQPSRRHAGWYRCFQSVACCSAACLPG
jgi:CHASE3 domain sensor protein